MGTERLKSIKRGVLAMRKMLREIETELERELAEVARGRSQDATEVEIRAISERVIGRLNGMIGKSFRPTAENTLYLIRCRIEEGYTEAQLHLVVDEMCYRWCCDDERQIYLRPETLFGNHFESYLQEAQTRSRPLFEFNELEKMAMEKLTGGNQNV